MTKIKQTPDFKFFVPVEITKATGKDGKEEMMIEGIASDASEDSDGETLQPAGYELDYFKKFGFLNWQHRAGVDPSSIVGEPIDAKVTNNKFYIKGRLFNDNPLAQQIYSLAKTLSDNGSTRRLGFSIEGKALERDLLNSKIIKRAKITGVAITPTPKNANTFLDVCKGEHKEGDFDYDYEKEDDEEVEKVLTTTSGAALQRESLEGNQKKLQKTKKTLTKSEVFGEIFATFPEIDLEKSKSIYNFITEVQLKLNKEMKNISQEAIDAAKQILKAASDELQKAEGNTATEGGPNEQGETNTANGASQADFGEKVTKAIRKAMKTCKSKEEVMKAVKAEMGKDVEGKDKEVEKAYDDADADDKKKALKKAEDDKKKADQDEKDKVAKAEADKKEADATKEDDDENEDDVDKAEGDDEDDAEGTTEKAKKIALKKAEMAKLQKEIDTIEKGVKSKKGSNDDLSKSFGEITDLIKGQNKQLSAIGTLQIANDANMEVLKSNMDELNKRVEEMEAISTGKKTVKTQGYVTKGNEDELNKGKNPKQLRVTDKKSIMKALELSIDIQKAEPGLVDEFVKYESATYLTNGLIKELTRAGYTLTK